MKKKIIFFISIIVLFFGVYKFAASKIYSDNDQESIISKLLPSNLKAILKQTIFIIPSKNKEILILKNKVSEKEIYINEIQEKLDRYVFHYKNAITNIENLPFKKDVTNYEFNIFDKKFNLVKFEQNILSNPKHKGAKSSVYLEEFQNNIFLATGDANIFYFDKDSLYNKNFVAKKIYSNLSKITKDKLFKENWFGIKDVLIFNEKIYLSFTKEVSKNCFNTSILSSKVNYNYLEFREFFTNDFCVKKVDGEDFNAHQSGGRMTPVDNENIVFSHGDYRQRYLAQDTNFYFGKILKINTINKKIKIISQGHRNPQGLQFVKSLNGLISSEHGPEGGDEINIINLGNDDIIQNFGWPISSYGEHYNGGKENPNNSERYKKYPLYKSHEKYGFIEPIKYFLPSIAISEVLFLDDYYKKKINFNFVVGAMGKMNRKGNLGLHFFNYDLNKGEYLNEYYVNLGERVRDMIKLKTDGKILMYLETTGSLAFLE